MPRPRVKQHWAADIKRVGGYRCSLEHAVACTLEQWNKRFSYEMVKLPYVVHHEYIADFLVGDVFIEVKGYWPSEQRTKMRLLMKCNPDIKLFVALERPNTRISRQSNTTYADWCKKYAIPWCPIPINKEFLEAWLRGERVTY